MENKQYVVTILSPDRLDCWDIQLYPNVPHSYFPMEYSEAKKFALHMLAKFECYARHGVNISILIGRAENDRCINVKKKA